MWANIFSTSTNTSTSSPFQHLKTNTRSPVELKQMSLSYWHVLNSSNPPSGHITPAQVLLATSPSDGWCPVLTTDPWGNLTWQRTGHLPSHTLLTHSHGHPRPHQLCSYPYHSTYACLQFGFQLFLNTQCNRRHCALRRNSGHRVIWGSELCSHTLNSVGDKKASLSHAHISDHIKGRYMANPPLICMYISGEGLSTSDPTPSQEVDTSNPWLQSGQLGIFKILSSKGFLPPVVFESMNKGSLGEVLCMSRGHHPLMSGLPWNPQCQQACMPWNNHHMESSAYCSHKAPTTLKELLTTYP